MAGIDRATIDVAISKTAMESAKAELIYGVRIAYLRAVASREAEGVAKLSLTEAQNLFSETKAKVEAGALAPYQKIAAEAGLYTREEDLLRAQGEYEKAINGLKELLGVAPDLKIDIAPGMEIALPLADANTAVDKALAARPDISELKLRRNRAEVDLRLAADSLRPELGFTGGFGFQGEDREYFGSLNEMDNFSWNAGLLYTVPLGGNSAAKAKMQSAELSIDDINLQVRALDERVRREVTDTLVELGNAKERLRVSQTGLEAARVKMDAEKQRFELGLITAGDLLEYEREYSQAQLAEVQARIELLQAEALLAKLTNSD
jgi:outer membrane protein TolC